jgi:transposase
MGNVALDCGVGQCREEVTLFVGCDVGGSQHAVAIIDGAGTVLEKLDRVYNHRKGFEFLLGKIKHWAKRTGAKRIQFAFEPTGHYWKSLVHFISEQGIEVFFIKTTAVKAMRELTDSTPSKNDRRDAATLAQLLRERKVLKGPPSEGVWRELRELVQYRHKLSDAQVELLLKLRAIIDEFFPELVGVFSSTSAVGLRELLKTAPFPKDLLAAGNEWLCSHLKKWTRRGKTAGEKAEALMEAAKNSIGLPARPGDRRRLESVLRGLDHYKRELQVVEKEMKRVLMETGYGEILLSFPGIGVVSAATFLGELGDPTNFETASQVVSFAGIDPSEKSSGKKKGRMRISKKGRPLMRTTLYFMAMGAILHCPELKAYYEDRKKEIEEGRLDIKPMQLVFAVAIKQVRILFAMCRDKAIYQPNSMELKEAA